jgi:hypothetical protein
MRWSRVAFFGIRFAWCQALFIRMGGLARMLGRLVAGALSTVVPPLYRESLTGEKGGW